MPMTYLKVSQHPDQLLELAIVDNARSMVYWLRWLRRRIRGEKSKKGGSGWVG